jgi:hypothetical protein
MSYGPFKIKLNNKTIIKLKKLKTCKSNLKKSIEEPPSWPV